jgi:bla regulator protein blaR1
VGDIVAFVVQGVLLTGAAAALSRVLPIERPVFKLAWWHVALAATLALPFVGPWAPSARIQIHFGSLGPVERSSAVSLDRLSWAGVVAVVLALGFAVRALRLARGAWGLRSCRLRAVPFESRALGGLEAAVGARAELRLSRDVSVPATFGLHHPVVLLPDGVLEMEDERQRAIVAHELIHVRRRDWPFAIAEEALAAVLWFHPAVHYLLGRIRLAREQCVDAAVVATLGDREVYLESLVEVARRRAQPRWLPAALFLGECHLIERVELLLKEVAMSKLRAVSHLAVSAFVLALAGALTSSSFPLSAWAGAGEASKPVRAPKAAAGEPRLVHRVDPVYPPEAKKKHLEGLVHIEARLAKDGSVAEATAVDGDTTLAEAALAAVRQWRYEPVLGPDKTPVEVKLTVTVNFVLAG